MSLIQALLVACLVCFSVASPTSSSTERTKRPVVHDDNASNIFNSVVDSLRQFGSSLHLNGMSFFVAHIPEGTTLYHGTMNHTSPTGIDWLAFEPEHSLLFERFFQQMSPGQWHREHCGGFLPQQSLEYPSAEDATIQSDTNLGDAYLHTYRSKHDLRILYIDGQSAAKWPFGVLDSQDKVILDAASAYPPPSIILDERPRMAQICRLVSELWGGKIHGILRMEAGFEFISCSFKDDVQLVNINRISTGYEKEWFYEDVMNYLKSIATRYDGVGSHRITLDYETMLSMYAYGDLVLTDEYNRPRINNETNWIDVARADLRAMVLDDSLKKQHDWRSIADMYVQRYTDKIEYLLSSDPGPDIAEMHHFAHQAMRPFIDTRRRDRDTEIHRCATQNLPYATFSISEDSVVPAQAVYRVAHRICTEMTQLQDIHTAEEVISRMKELRRWLDWASFKNCRGCGPDEFCSVPLYPLAGFPEDLERPRCRNTTDVFWDERNFWFYWDWKKIVKDWKSPDHFRGNHTDRHW